ncbi:serine/threonine protein kinase [Myxococcus eversor]|uniref:serine/threonine protein kinase n=1 Tax=Myxococcus eversor TaxID=2709661 RepID=UPI0013D6085E|nr:serine/threonine-protein kinase [Myxococcus eversor]
MQLGKYQLVRKLATGGMAEVFLAKAAGPGGFEKTLVLKRILPHLAEDPSFVEMFLGEARLVAGLNHPHIVQIFDFGEAEGSYFLAMELIDGPNLRRWQRQAASKGQPLAPNICAKVVAQAAEGLAFAHDFADPTTGQPLGLIHRDVSPDNILVSRQGAVKVVDFGIAKVAGQKHRTQTGIVKGKVAYMPPEQVRADPLDRRVDVYALGVVLYELLTGKLPIDGASELVLMQAIVSREPMPVSRYRQDVPAALQDIITRALRKDREDRYPDCRALQVDLERFVLSVGEPVGAYQVAQAVEQVVEERIVPTPAPMLSRPEAREAREETPERTVPSGPSRKPLARTGERAEAPAVFEQETETRPRVDPRNAKRKMLVPAAITGAVLLVAGGGYALLGRGTSAPVPETPTGASTNVAGAPEAPMGAPAQVAGSPEVPIGTSATVAGSPETQTGTATAAQGATKTPPPAQDAEDPQGEAALEAQLAAKRAQGELVVGADEDSGLLSYVASPASDTQAPSAEPKKPASRAVKGALGSVAFRIRPYAVVYLDGKKLGETPLATIDVPEGIYAVTAVNTRLGKKVTRSFEVKAGTANVFKLNLSQD